MKSKENQVLEGHSPCLHGVQHPDAAIIPRAAQNRRFVYCRFQPCECLLPCYDALVARRSGLFKALHLCQKLVQLRVNRENLQ